MKKPQKPPPMNTAAARSALECLRAAVTQLRELGVNPTATIEGARVELLGAAEVAATAAIETEERRAASIAIGEFVELQSTITSISRTPFRARLVAVTRSHIHVHDGEGTCHRCLLVNGISNGGLGTWKIDADSLARIQRCARTLMGAP